MNLVKTSCFFCLIISLNLINAQTPPWALPNTGNNHTIGIVDTALNGSGVVISSGDYYGVFYDSSGTLACAGYTLYSGSTCAIPAWGDDNTTVAKDGLAIGESMTIKLWQNSTNNIIDLIVEECYPGLDSTLYSINGQTMITKFSTDSSTIVSALSSDVIGLMPKLYPNPNDGNEIYINWGEIDGFPVILSLFDLSGKLIIKETFHKRVDKVNFSQLGLKEGYYIIDLSTDNASYTLRTLIR